MIPAIAVVVLTVVAVVLVAAGASGGPLAIVLVLLSPFVALGAYLLWRHQDAADKARAEQERVEAEQAQWLAYHQYQHDSWTQEQDQRYRRLVATCGEETAQRLMQGQIWVGQRQEHLYEALGHPLKVQEKVLRSKNHLTCFYRPDASGRCHLKVMLENGEVIGWEAAPE